MKLDNKCIQVIFVDVNADINGILSRIFQNKFDISFKYEYCDITHSLFITPLVRIFTCYGVSFEF